jgi:hypothetical protein
MSFIPQQDPEVVEHGLPYDITLREDCQKVNGEAPKKLDNLGRILYFSRYIFCHIIQHSTDSGSSAAW